MRDALVLIEELSHKEPKNLLERFAKLSEECGELAQELLIAQNASGFAHKSQGADGILGESTDIILVALSIFFKGGGSQEDLFVLLTKKCDKWRQYQRST